MQPTRLKSRKFLLAIATVLGLVLQAVVGLDLEPEAIAGLVVIALGWIGVEGVIDKAGITAVAAQEADEAKQAMGLYIAQMEQRLASLMASVGMQPGAPELEVSDE